jgi:SH3 domain-containing YSC84-like protein 1
MCYVHRTNQLRISRTSAAHHPGGVRRLAFFEKSLLRSGHGKPSDYIHKLNARKKTKQRCAEQEKDVRTVKKLLLSIALLSLVNLGWAGTTREKSDDRLENAGKVLQEIMNTPDKGIPEEVLEHAKCVAVVPHMLKGGFVFGAENGRGVATCRTANGWSAPAFFAITGGNFGLQIGIEGVDLVMVFQGDKSMERLLSNKFTVGADASAAAGPVGRHAQAGTDWKLETGILTYSRAKGLFAGITLKGASIRRDDDSTHAIYGREVSNRDVLTGKVKPTAGAQPFLAAVRHAKSQAVEAGK